MTITEANQIWKDCYMPEGESKWNDYTWEQREQAISVRDCHAAASRGSYGVWDISDRY